MSPHFIVANEVDRLCFVATPITRVVRVSSASGRCQRCQRIERAHDSRSSPRRAPRSLKMTTSAKDAARPAVILYVEENMMLWQTVHDVLEFAG